MSLVDGDGVKEIDATTLLIVFYGIFNLWQNTELKWGVLQHF